MTALANRKHTLLDVLTILLLTLVISALLIVACGASPVEAAGLFVKGIFGTKSSFAEIFVKACPLILTGLGCAVAFRTGFFNIGAEGQFYVGALAATMVALGLPQVPGVVRIVLCFVAAFVCGGLWALIAAVFKTRFNISEIIVTIMLNYIVINFLGYAVRSFLMDPAGNVPQSAKIDQAVQLPNLITSTRFHAGIVLAFVLAAVVWFLMEKTTVGYELKAVGLNSRAAACNGVPVVRSIISSAFLSGGLAAIAGSIEVLAIQKKLMEGISADCGYTAVLIALVAFNRPLGVVAVAILYAAMEVGASSMQRQLGVPSAIVSILIGVVVVLILAKEMLRWYNLRKKG
ncbi:ABC transporter permease [Pseudoflavonifractor phocaeensis]|uniref:ABC transporter permease n=1 Tax=Pseudoflavonifractor phocaeensis TaxID=1870988 RepID=UPI0025A3FF3F|nr:ABC transporter permease [Pseudoflavonifractor phocaeensis]MDM8238547.1 ABC transporter permease [Pseudoflavonifractor phocaeensis]